VLNGHSRTAAETDSNSEYAFAVNSDGVRIVADYKVPGANVDRSASTNAAYVFDWQLAFDEQYFHIKHYLLTGIGAAVAMVFVIMMLLIAHPVGAIVATTMVVIIEVEVIGVLGLAGLKLNAVTLINLIMIIGIAVEFVAHITRAAVLPPPNDKGAKTSAERAVYALYEMGPPVLNGAMSTFLAVVCIAASPFVYFVRYFFGMYALTILVCLWNSLIVLPIILSYIVPPLAGEVTSRSTVFPSEAALRTVSVAVAEAPKLET
jgi:predicted RND superfamily exporter protein